MRTLGKGRLHALAIALVVAMTATASRAQESLDDIDKGKADAPVSPAVPASPSLNAQPVAVPATVGAGAPAATPAAPVLEMGSKEGKATAEVNGYVDNRFQFGWSHTGGLVPTGDVPTLTNLLEGNIQLKVGVGKKLFFYGDISVFFQAGGLYYDADSMGNRVQVAEHDVASLRGLIVPAELYASYTPVSWLSLLVGKKRITWGSGFGFNPTDLINPPKDPTDPTFQRAGAWVARVEAPFEKFTISALFSPSVLYQQSGIPYSVLYYQGYDVAKSMTATPLAPQAPLSTDAHFLAAARLYLLLWNSDINLVYYFSNLYRGDDDFKTKSRVGLSFSRYFFTDWELHLEALGQLGTTRRYANSDVANGGVPPAIPAGTNAIDTFLPQNNINSNDVYAKLILGTRRTFSDESNLSIEYYYQGDGYSHDQLQDYVRLLSRAKSAGLLSQLGLASSGSASSGGLPQKFSFDPLRRHYLIASYIKPKIADDWTLGLTLIAGLEDLSGLISPTVSWAPKEWLSLSLTGFVPFHGIPVGTVCAAQLASDGSCPKGQDVSEYSLFPQDVRALFEVRMFY